ncbi:DEAD/DEAH box helicase [Nitrincola tapanii]|uniref:DEAD/DEAH box helicase n=1 Tax=Nitrincola tapanii TaxID=1708751 RepID=A0A5A9W6P5_9GAMM|nr:DEAD/DEAH box helicase [Nitrincola tapanii]KAA0876470.1 DEAD/DEAH box helicase [Nitrincola tapanii]
MSQPFWGYLTPKTVAQWIDFGQAKEGVDPADQKHSMPAKQIEGVAYLWNLLSSQGVALLADEVGTGKTFQALGVAALLWKIKPDARILVMAPNRDLCFNWKREFSDLVTRHYPHTDHQVKSGVDGDPIPSVQVCGSLTHLAEQVELGTAHLYLTTIHALSHLLTKEDREKVKDGKSEAVQILVGQIAGEIHKQIKNAEVIGAEGFDLLIIDEAHYLRNVRGGSQKVEAAKAFFGSDPNPPLAQKVLLLTATPTHSRLDDVGNILGYFIPAIYKHDKKAERARDYLTQYGLRRMRVLEAGDKSYSKLHYRREKALPAEFNSPEEEGFFALYQKRLVEARASKERGKRIRLMYGYLEGFESFRVNQQEDDVQGVGEENKTSFSRAADTELIMALTASYQKKTGQLPKHPKYDSLIQECVASLPAPDSIQSNNYKHLIFVRRIPSVRELTQRLNERYDQLLWQEIAHAWGDTGSSVELDQTSWHSREAFKQYVKARGESETGIHDDEGSDEGIAEESHLSSRIAELFVAKKKEVGGQTDATLVRLRFIRPDSLFSLFLEPSSDYLKGGYQYYYSNEGSEGKKPNYKKAAEYCRFKAWDSPTDLRAAVGDLRKPDKLFDKNRTLFSVWALLTEGLPSHLREKLERWAKEDKAVAEHFSNYVKVGFLYASPVIVEIYSWFVEFRRDTGVSVDAQKSYQEFFGFVKPKIKGSRMLAYFIAALETFESVCEKIAGKKLSDWRNDWSVFTGLTSPAWYASGESGHSRKRLMIGFNSPFYPHVLVATSVFQEGVNLHLNCDQVHHYGLPGSPGDNEQRVGRLDRLFGCVHRKLEQGVPERELGIHYPFLQNSVDEDQVASFIERKRSVEDRMDLCLESDFDPEVKTTSLENWKEYLRTPVPIEQIGITDPYPAKFDQPDSYPVKFATGKALDDQVAAWFKEAIKEKDGKVEPVDTSQTAPRPLLKIDLTTSQPHSQSNTPPIFVTLGFMPRLSALVTETVYIVSLSAHVANFKNIEQLCKTELDKKIAELSSKYPLVRLALEKEKGHPFFLNTRLNYPLLMRANEPAVLSPHVIRQGLEEVADFTNELRSYLSQEASIEQHIDQSQRIPGPAPLPESFSGDPSSNLVDWKSLEALHGQADYLENTVSVDRIKDLLKIFCLDTVTEECKIVKCLMLNSRLPFMNFCWQPQQKDEMALRVGLCAPAAVNQQTQRRLLQRWFSYVISQSPSKEQENN